MEKEHIINCHTHIFTGDHVPPFLAKTILPWPFHYLLSLRFILWLLKSWYKGPYKWQFKPWYKRIAKFLYQAKVVTTRFLITNVLYHVSGIWLTIHVFFFLFDEISNLPGSDSAFINILIKARKVLVSFYLFNEDIPPLFQIIGAIILLIFFKSGRNLIFFILKRIWSFLGVLPGKQTKDLLKRYLNIGRFSMFRTQAGILGKLSDQYPPNTSFVILPMDMEFMDAGKVKEEYKSQMEELASLKRRLDKIYPEDRKIYPFIFVDPRRIRKDPQFFSYDICDNKVILKDCFIKEYIEDNKFSGFKIYPALGYYPFDESLLPLWKYAADNEIPIMTHCIRGSIYYRGRKRKEWDTHPVFEQSLGKNKCEPLLLPQTKNSDFTVNFTHPLNYLCLLEEVLLRKLVGNASDKIRELFGYDNESKELVSNLKNLKMCFGHFGGDDEWRNFFELDRYNYSNQIIKTPNSGIHFFRNKSNLYAPGKLEQIWNHADWYSIICSLILQYPNIYGDISYIIHDNEIMPLLKKTINHSNSHLGQRVLFGTDFYVVRNHKSEKNMVVDTLSNLSEVEFDQIARINPRTYLKRI